MVYNLPIQYSGTSDKGPSEIEKPLYKGNLMLISEMGTTSLYIILYIY